MSTPSMAGRVCVVTGANTGIGKATALGLARLGAEVVLACRDRSRGEAALAEIRQASGSDKLSLMLVDLASQSSIRAFASEYKASGKPLHVLVNNAGLMLRSRQVNADGFEMTFAVNHLGPFLLTNLLLDVLQRSAPARIVNVSSSLHKKEKLDFDDLQHVKRFKGMSVYGESKLANLYFTYELARRLAGTGVTVNALHPGVVGTELARDVPRGNLFGKLFFISPEKGAQTSIYLASAPEVATVTGQYFGKSRVQESSPLSRDPAIAQRLWEVSERMTGLAPR